MPQDFSHWTHEDFVAFEQQRTKVAREYKAAHAEEIAAEQQQRAVEILGRKNDVLIKVDNLLKGFGYKLDGSLNDHMLLMSKPEPKRKDYAKEEDFELEKSGREDCKARIMKRRYSLDIEARKVDIVKTVLEHKDSALFGEWNVARHW